LVEEGANDMLERQMVEKVHITLIFMQINDVSINLFIGVSFPKKICPNGCIIFQRSSPLTLWLQYKELACLLTCLFVFPFLNLLYYLLFQNEEMNALKLIERENK
jgi:hypothetical protein